MKRLLLVLFAISLFSCSDRIEDTRDPVTKTEYILDAIHEKKFGKVQNEYLGIENHPEKREILAEMSARILDGFETYGFPDHNQIRIQSHAKWPIAKRYCSEFNGNIVPVVSTATQLGSRDDLIIHMQFAIVNHQARLLNLSVSDNVN